LTAQEVNYCVTRKELLAIVYHIKQFKCYLLGKHFIVRTDHSSLKYLKRFKEPEGQLARWLDFLQPFDFEIITRPGHKHGNADALSRRCPGKKCQCEKFGFLEFETPVNLEVKLSENKAIQTENDFLDVANKVEISPLWSEDEIKMAQTDDPDIGAVISLLREGKGKPTWQEISKLSPKTKYLVTMANEFILQNDILYKRAFNINDNDSYLRLVVPQKYYKLLCEQLHDSVVGGHLGYNKTIESARNRYFWPEMKDYIRRWIQSCHVCQIRKDPPQKARMRLGQYQVGGRWELHVTSWVHLQPQIETILIY
jgi:hypothetical protein